MSYRVRISDFRKPLHISHISVFSPKLKVEEMCRPESVHILSYIYCTHCINSMVKKNVLTNHRAEKHNYQGLTIQEDSKYWLDKGSRR